MAEKVKILVRERSLEEKSGEIRRQGFIPAIIYGKGVKPISLTLNWHDFDLCYRKAGGNTIIDMEIEKEDGDKEKKNALIHEIDQDPVTDKIIHVDFLAIKMSEKITAQIPLNFVGDSIAVIEQGGSLLTHRDEVEVECLPASLPKEIVVDITPLVDFENVIHVKDLDLPEGVVVLDDPEETIVYVEAPRSEEELAELEEPVAPTEELPPSEHGEEKTIEGEDSETAQESKEKQAE